MQHRPGEDARLWAAGGSLFDDFFNGFLETPGGHTAPRRESPARRTAPSPQAEQVDVTQFFSDATTELLQRAAQQAVEWGSLDLTSEHLLHASLEDEVVRRVLEGADADPESIRAQLEEDVDKDKSAPMSLLPWLRTPSGRSWPLTRSRGLWILRTLDRSMSCSRWPRTRSPRPDACSRASGFRIPSYAERWCAGWTRGSRREQVSRAVKRDLPLLG